METKTELRSRIMKSNRPKDTRPEVFVRKQLHAMGVRFRLHRKDLPGSPDIVLPKLRLVIFVNGCFWHQHPGCPKATMPKTREAFWADKFASNKLRDQRNAEQLRELGWRVGVVWECETKDGAALDKILSQLLEAGVKRGLPL